MSKDLAWRNARASFFLADGKPLGEALSLAQERSSGEQTEWIARLLRQVGSFDVVAFRSG